MLFPPTCMFSAKSSLHASARNYGNVLLVFFACFSGFVNASRNVSAVELAVPPLAACQPALITWDGGFPPYSLNVLQSGTSNVLKSFGALSNNSFNWAVDLPPGTNVTVQLEDGKGSTDDEKATVETGNSNSSTITCAARGNSSQPVRFKQPPPPALDPGSIVGITVAAVALVVAMCLLFLYRRRRLALSRPFVEIASDPEAQRRVVPRRRLPAWLLGMRRSRGHVEDQVQSGAPRQIVDISAPSDAPVSLRTASVGMPRAPPSAFHVVDIRRGALSDATSFQTLSSASSRTRESGSTAQMSMSTVTRNEKAGSSNPFSSPAVSGHTSRASSASRLSTSTDLPMFSVESSDNVLRSDQLAELQALYNSNLPAEDIASVVQRMRADNDRAAREELRRSEPPRYDDPR